MTETETITETTVNLGTDRRELIDRSALSEAKAKSQRISVPLDVTRWNHLNRETQDALLWFHQHCLDNHYGYQEAKKAIGYDHTTVFRVLNGTYPADKNGGYTNIVERILSYKKIVSERSAIRQNQFVPNRISRLIFSGLDYALANNSITLICGESRFGKTTAVKAWKEENNHGRSVFITAPAFGGTGALFQELCKAIGSNLSTSLPEMHRSVLRAFNENRILIIDEAHRLLPQPGRNATNLEIIRDIHDRTHCAVALIATQRFDAELRKADYQFEQLLGRIGMPIRLPKKIYAADILPIVEQYVQKPGNDLLDACVKLSNDLGRLGVLVETLKVASRIANKGKEEITTEHVFKAMRIRQQMTGGEYVAQ